MEGSFSKNPLYFRIIADSEAVDDIEDSKAVGNKTNKIYKQNTVLNGYHIISELDDVLQSGHYEFPLGYDNADWYVSEVKKLETRMNFHFKNTKNIIVLAEEDETDFKYDNVCRFCEKNIESDEFEKHCNLTGKIQRSSS